MKPGGFVLLINATPWAWTQVAQHTYQMSHWTFPCTVNPGESVRVYIEPRQKLTHTYDDGAEVSYSIPALSTSSNPTNKTAWPSFEIAYHGQRALNSPTVEVRFKNLATAGNKNGTVLKLDFHEDQNMPFVLAAPQSANVSAPGLVSSNPPVAWMRETYETIKCLSLREVCMPGSHDAGMSSFSAGSGLATPPNTVTQELDIGGQLRAGARWFDMRPVIAGGHWRTGHYSFGLTTWHGGNGQMFTGAGGMVEQINTFLEGEGKGELVVVRFQQGFNTDNFKGDKKNKLSQDEWATMMAMFRDGLRSRVIGLGTESDLTRLPLSRFIADGKSAVILVVDATAADDKRVVVSTDLRNQGIVTIDQFPLYDSYADSRDPDTMINNQLTKMKDQRKHADDRMFLLSWTLTQLALSIVDAAVDVNRKLGERLWPAVVENGGRGPNIIGVDAFPGGNRDIAALAVAVNYNFARVCSGVVKRGVVVGRGVQGACAA